MRGKMCSTIEKTSEISILPITINREVFSEKNFPIVLFQKSFSFLFLQDIGNIILVSKHWKHITDMPSLWIQIAKSYPDLVLDMTKDPKKSLPNYIKTMKELYSAGLREIFGGINPIINLPYMILERQHLSFDAFEKLKLEKISPHCLCRGLIEKENFVAIRYTRNNSDTQTKSINFFICQQKPPGLKASWTTFDLWSSEPSPISFGALSNKHEIRWLKKLINKDECFHLARDYEHGYVHYIEEPQTATYQRS